MMVISISDMKRNSWKNFCRQCECVLKWTIEIFIRKDGSMVDVILLQGAKNSTFFQRMMLLSMEEYVWIYNSRRSSAR
jgi:hypothetical protein